MQLSDAGFLDIGAQRLEYRMIGPLPDVAATLDTAGKKVEMSFADLLSIVEPPLKFADLGQARDRCRHPSRAAAHARPPQGDGLRTEQD